MYRADILSFEALWTLFKVLKRPKTQVLERSKQAIPENREFRKWKFSFSHQRHALSTSFDIFVVTYRVTNFLPKLIYMLLFSTEKTEFLVSVFSILGLPLISGYAQQAHMKDLF